jgi:hypothetical protein
MTGQEIIPPNGSAVMQAPERQALTPMELLSNAIERGVDLPMLERLMDLQDRHERAQAKKAFDQARADAKRKIPVIKKNREGHNKKRYADYAAYAEVVDPILAEHGLNASFRPDQTDTKISVTCILSHRDGHREESTLSGPPDNTGNKNAIQAIGSTLSYLQRYTLCLALGLAATEDDDGQAAGNDLPIAEEQLQALLKRVSDTHADAERLCKYIGVSSLAELPQSKLAEVSAILDDRQRKADAKAKSKSGAAA